MSGLGPLMAGLLFSVMICFSSIYYFRKNKMGRVFWLMLAITCTIPVDIIRTLYQREEYGRIALGLGGGILLGALVIFADVKWGNHTSHNLDKGNSSS